MQEAGESAVLGDFNNAKFKHYGVESTFFKRDGKFMVRTDGADGRLADFEIKYTFGVWPLQQYLIEFPGGRYQTLGIAWDSRTKSEGGAGHDVRRDEQRSGAHPGTANRRVERAM